MNQKQANHRERIRQTIIDGIDRETAYLMRHLGSPCTPTNGDKWEMMRAKCLQDVRTSIADEILDRLLDRYTIRERVRK